MMSAGHSTSSQNNPVLGVHAAVSRVDAAHDAGEDRDTDQDSEADARRDEARILPHDYDGIHEYDNPLPGWWSAVFAACVVFAFLYFAYYNIAGWGKSPGEGYQAALAGWQASYKGGPGGGGGPSVSEELFAAGAQNPELVARGADVFANRCVGCHEVDGRGKIGPNLTDLYQLHGTTRMDLFSTIQGGVPGTAMIAWGETIKPAEVIAVATFVGTLRGKNLSGKEPQGKPVAALAR
jgi:cytochrome c oxidase cbb3-type subunit 3